LDSWSGGISETEASILKAYRDLIANAEHYIYIENQFFITTSNPSKDTEVQNDIGLQLVNRIIKAHE
jgi:phospholipase D1/2